MTWPTWTVCIYGSVVALVAFWAGRRHQRREIAAARRRAGLIERAQIGLISVDEYNALTRRRVWRRLLDWIGGR